MDYFLMFPVQVAVINADSKASLTFGEIDQRAELLATSIRKMLMGLKKGEREEDEEEGKEREKKAKEDKEEIEEKNMEKEEDGNKRENQEKEKNHKGKENEEPPLVCLRYVPNDELVVILLALFRLGLAYVPVSMGWPKDRVRYIVEDSKPAFILTNSKPAFVEEALENCTHCIPIVTHQDLADKVEENMVLPDDDLKSVLVNKVMAVLYTSGSTGQPKGVRLLHSSAVNR